MSNPGGVLVINPRIMLRTDTGMLNRRPSGYETPNRTARASKVTPATRMFFRIPCHYESISPMIRLGPGDRIHGNGGLPGRGELRHVLLDKIFEHFLNDFGGWTRDFYLGVPLFHPDLPGIGLVGHGAVAMLEWLLTIPRRNVGWDLSFV